MLVRAVPCRAVQGTWGAAGARGGRGALAEHVRGAPCNALFFLAEDPRFEQNEENHDESALSLIALLF